MKDKISSNFYNAILQNLFFGTLNQRMNERKFADEGNFDINRKEYGIKSLYRYSEKFLINKKEVLELFGEIPFLNGGLFDCLDKEDDAGKVIYIDGFSRNPKKQSIIPDYLFFQQEEERVDLSSFDLGNNRPVRGLIEILNSYNFTVDENTPIDQDIALDPELLGKVFENLLACYNPETKTTARKATGSYYTPREIVNYMVEESLVEYLKVKLSWDEEKIRSLLSYSDELPEFREKEKEKIIGAIDNIKILDPVCGSGAFPMGILHKLVHVLQKLDPENKYWYELQFEKALKESEKIYDKEDRDEREEKLKEINETFDEGVNYPDYARKLYLIENCIFGVDIQPIAIQISKLRFFISLVLDQKIDRNKENLGIRALPNLETKFVSANTLVGIQKSQIVYIKEIRDLENEIKSLRSRYFQAKTRKEKLEYQKKDRKLRKLLFQELNQIGMSFDSSEKISSFDIYDQNASASWFDTEWMFGVKDGFDIVIGNPPYIFARESKSKGLDKELKIHLYRHYTLARYQINSYPLFIELSNNVLKNTGILSVIVPNNWMTINTNKELRRFILEKSDIKLVNFYAKVFETASVDNSVIIYRKSGGNKIITLYEYETSFNLIKKCETKLFLAQKDYIINMQVLKNNEIADLIFKIENNSLPLNEISSVKAGLMAYETGKGKPIQTEKMKVNRVYHSKIKIDETYFKYLDGQDVCRYFLNWSGEYLKYGNNLAAPRTSFALFSSPRILVRQIPSKPPYCINACLTDEIILNDRNSMNIINIKYGPKYVLAILNSKLTSFWFIYKFGKMQRGIFPQFKVNELEMFPVPRISGKQQEPLIALVDQILATRQKDPGADISSLEHRIDQMVYKLYGLTKEEIEIVDGKK